MSAPVPDWVLELGAVGGDVCDCLAGAVTGSSGWFVRSDATGGRLVASVNAVGAARPRQVVTVAGGVLAVLWPGWLDGWGVGCTIWLPSMSWTGGADVMAGRATGALGVGEWWAAGEVTLG